MPTPEGASSRRWPALPLAGRRVWSMSMRACISQLDLHELQVAPIDEIGRARVAEARGRPLLALQACATEHRAPSASCQWPGVAVARCGCGCRRAFALPFARYLADAEVARPHEVEGAVPPQDRRVAEHLAARLGER